MAYLKGRERAQYVTRMFARISRRYDLLNSVMTAGRHYAWRRLAADMAVRGLSGQALDVATGTGDFAFDVARKPGVSRVVGLDYTREMLDIAVGKARERVSVAPKLDAGAGCSLPRQARTIRTTSRALIIQERTDSQRIGR